MQIRLLFMISLPLYWHRAVETMWVRASLAVRPQKKCMRYCIRAVPFEEKGAIYAASHRASSFPLPCCHVWSVMVPASTVR